MLSGLIDGYEIGNQSIEISLPSCYNIGPADKALLMRSEGESSKHSDLIRLNHQPYTGKEDPPLTQIPEEHTTLRSFSRA